MSAQLLSLLFVLVAALMSVPAALAQPAPQGAGSSVEPIRYTLTFPAPHTHYVDVRALVPTAGQPAIEMMMAVWTPGSYLVREYERHVEAVTAAGTQGVALRVEKSSKNRWRIDSAGAAAVTVSYRVYGREMSVRTNWIEAGFALINGAPTFLTLADNVRRPHEVTIVPARGWARSFTGLAPLPGGEHRYRADDYDMLVDSPILLGNPAVYEFTVGGRRHYLVNEGEGGVFDGARAARDLEAIARECLRMWGELPYDRYLFLNVITEASGGLEHANSTVLMTSRWTTRSRRSYVNWLATAAHELLHVWNVKRLRPVELGPFDYEQEVFTRSLWIAEGITDYLADVVLHRAGLITRDELLEGLTARMQELQASPGRLVQSVEQASFDAWIKYYRPDENSANTSISYYTKGALVGWLLDARIRNLTGGTRGVDDVLRAAYGRYSGPRGFTPDEFRTVAEQVAGASLTSFWDSYVRGTRELDYAEALQTLGLQLRGGGADNSAWLGATTRNDGGRLLVSQVRRDSPAHTAGLNVDDEIIALGEFRVRADRFDARLEQHSPGERVSILVARREQLLRLDVTLGAEPVRIGRLTLDTGAPARAQQIRDGWLAAPAAPR